jgi:hypothetical protein
MDQTPTVRRLTNAPTWPMQPQPQHNMSTGPSGYPYSAPVAGPSQAIPANAIGYTLNPGTHIPRVPVGGHYRTSPDSSSRTYQSPHPPSHRSTLPALPEPRMSPAIPAGEEMPLIISTPRGVQGAFDLPNRQTSGRGRPETPILAPVPRRPKPNTQAAVLRPAEGAAEPQPQPIYSGTSAIRQQHIPVPAAPLASGPPSSGGLSGRFPPPGLGRQPSRAERSAARNMADAKKRGWSGRVRPKSGKKKKKNAGADGSRTRELRDRGGDSSWTEVGAGMPLARSGTPNGRRDRQDGMRDGRGGGHKCVVM